MLAVSSPKEDWLSSSVSVSVSVFISPGVHGDVPSRHDRFREVDSDKLTGWLELTHHLGQKLVRVRHTLVALVIYSGLAAIGQGRLTRKALTYLFMDPGGRRTKMSRRNSYVKRLIPFAVLNFSLSQVFVFPRHFARYFVIRDLHFMHRVVK